MVWGVGGKGWFFHSGVGLCAQKRHPRERIINYYVTKQLWSTASQSVKDARLYSYHVVAIRNTAVHENTKKAVLTKSIDSHKHALEKDCGTSIQIAHGTKTTTTAINQRCSRG